MQQLPKSNPLWDSSLPLEQRLDYLLASLTLEEKFSCLGTGCPDIPRLGIRAFYVGGEGAHGVQARHDQSFDKGAPQPTTIFPNPIGMSATWDRELIRQAGQAVGSEARAIYNRDGGGGLCLWAPTIDMERDPRWGRTEEAYGEDPYLTGEMASAYIQGLRGDDTKYIRCGATLKHFYANNVEDGRVWKSSSMDPRNKHEYYLEPFRKAVEQGGAEAIMTAYNEINGVPCILNDEVQKLAKDQWGVQHVVCDGGDMIQTVDCHHYYASHTETVAAGLKAGIDCFTDDINIVSESAREAYELGMITLEDIDRALRNHFRTMFRLGIFDEPPKEKASPEGGLTPVSGDMVRLGQNPYSLLGEDVINAREHQEISYQMAKESVVLLKNNPCNGKPLLPLELGGSDIEEPEDSYRDFYQEEDRVAGGCREFSVEEDKVAGGYGEFYQEDEKTENLAKDRRTLAVIGPWADAWHLDWYAGIPPYHVTPLEGIAKAMDVDVEKLRQQGTMQEIHITRFGKKQDKGDVGSKGKSSDEELLNMEIDVENRSGLQNSSESKDDIDWDQIMESMRKPCGMIYESGLPQVQLQVDAGCVRRRVLPGVDEAGTSTGKEAARRETDKEDERLNAQPGMVFEEREKLSWLGILEDGKTIGLVDKEKAEIFEITMWDQEQITLRAMSNGMFLTTEDGTDANGCPNSGTVTATKDMAFGWFVRESFRVKQPIDVWKTIREGIPMTIQAWNGNPLYVDEERRLHVREQEDGQSAEEMESAVGAETVQGAASVRDPECIRSAASVRDPECIRSAEPVRDAECVQSMANAGLVVRPVLVKDGLQAAAQAAERADVVLYIGGAHPMITCKEDMDRKDISYPQFQRSMLQELHAVNPDIILALITSVPYGITWEDENIPAILTMASGSQELGHALADVIFGETSPAGRLNMTWYRDDSQLPDMDDYDIIQKPRTYQYFQGDVLYPFGHGLSYSMPVYEKMSVIRQDIGQLEVEVQLGNWGDYVTDEVVQVYAAKLPEEHCPVKYPVHKLVAFERVKDLKVGETRNVTLNISLRDLEYYDTVQRRKLLAPGEYEIQVGPSSGAIMLRERVTLAGTDRGSRDGFAWNPADHYDRSENTLLWEGHMGYDSVVNTLALPGQEGIKRDDDVRLPKIGQTGGLPGEAKEEDGSRLPESGQTGGLPGEVKEEDGSRLPESGQTGILSGDVKEQDASSSPTESGQTDVLSENVEGQEIMALEYHDITLDKSCAESAKDSEQKPTALILDGKFGVGAKIAVYLDEQVIGVWEKTVAGRACEQTAAEGWAAGADTGNPLRQNGFQEVAVTLSPAGREFCRKYAETGQQHGTLKFTGEGDIKLCRWKFA